MRLARSPRLLVTAKKQKAEIHSNTRQNGEEPDRHDVQFMEDQHPKRERNQSLLPQ